ncbi:NADH-quinone oxidoreductase subunit J [Coralloluteibacterium stylophorae]|uniref:NADH-quinone oxidoreductase subunit J n=2 Tax=Coralloluteibacterium stylophorae TaxID=1776034 RepID=A0AAP2G0H7_9GAMM|nr:NADH-quinone oxidoreductase subunit J [Coralloluteibacterium stylophorae]MBS7457591.1 NADH-quinone oxidoreductase subunit J [Coralloluteibacterium stylophorae]
MDFPLIAFYVFAAFAIAAALGVISARNPVYAVLSLVLTFFSTACLWILAEAEFLGIALVLVYVGAVMVLFLFVVMMLDINIAPLREGFARYLPVGIVVAVVMFAEMLTLIGVLAGRVSTEMSAVDPAAAAGLSNIEWIGRTLFSAYLMPFEVAAVILTVALIAAMMLTLRRREGTKHQDPGSQVRVRSGDRVRLVKMAAQPRRTTRTGASVETAGAGGEGSK